MSVDFTALIIAITASLLSFAGSWYWFSKSRDERIAEAARLAKEEVKNRITALEKELSLVRETVLPISVAMQELLVKQLTHFHTPIMDALLVKIGPPNALTADEEEQLAAALKERAQDMGDKIDASERDAALMLPMIMRRAKIESCLDPKQQQIQTVMLPFIIDEIKGDSL